MIRAQCTNPDEPRAASLSRSATCATTCASGASPRPARCRWCMVHGWMDVAASWQFVVDAFARDRYVIAPDWRGYGLTEVARRRQLLVPRLPGRPRLPARPLRAATQPVDLVGHSMGGNIAMLYAGARPAAHPPAGEPGRLRHARHAARRRRPAAMPSGWTSSRPCTAARWRSRATTTPDGVARRLMQDQPAAEPGQGRLAGPALGAPGRRRPLAHPGRRRPQDHQCPAVPRRRGAGALPAHRAARRCASKPATTASASGGRASSRWPSTTNACRRCPSCSIGRVERRRPHAAPRPAGRCWPGYIEEFLDG